MKIYYLCIVFLFCLALAERDPFVRTTVQTQLQETLDVRLYPIIYKDPLVVANTLAQLYPEAKLQGFTDSPAILVRANALQQRSIKDQLKLLDQPLPQICIEVQAIELNNNGLADLGIRWYLQDQIKLGTLDDAGRLLERLRLLIGQGKGSLKAAPKITTSLGIPAIIHIGDKIPYATAVENGTTTKYDIHYLDAGVILNILPEHISTSSMVLNIQPKVNSLKQWKQTRGGEYPILSSREVKTTVHIKDNAAFIIGGLLNQEKRSSLQKIPLLGDIPLIGSLFQHTTEETITSDTIFIVTARRV